MSSTPAQLRPRMLARWWRPAALLLMLVAILFAGGYAAGQGTGRVGGPEQFPLEMVAAPLAGGVGLVTAEQVLAADPAAIQLVDVRAADAYRLAHATGAISLPESETVAWMDTLPADRTLVLYCSCPDEKTSLRSARTLTGVFHVPHIVVLKGGLDAYVAAGGAVTSGGSDSGLEHQGCGCDTNAPAFKLWASNLAAERDRRAEQETVAGE